MIKFPGRKRRPVCIREYNTGCKRPLPDLLRREMQQQEQIDNPGDKIKRQAEGSATFQKKPGLT